MSRSMIHVFMGNTIYAWTRDPIYHSVSPLSLDTNSEWHRPHTLEDPDTISPTRSAPPKSIVAQYRDLPQCRTSPQMIALARPASLVRLRIGPVSVSIECNLRHLLFQCRLPR